MPTERLSPEQWERAADLAEARGCTPENPCWSECVDAAHEYIDAGEVFRDRSTMGRIKSAEALLRQGGDHGR